LNSEPPQLGRTQREDDLRATVAGRRVGGLEPEAARGVEVGEVVARPAQARGHEVQLAVRASDPGVDEFETRRRTDRCGAVEDGRLAARVEDDREPVAEHPPDRPQRLARPRDVRARPVPLDPRERDGDWRRAGGGDDNGRWCGGTKRARPERGATS
jgi:hypothetical protein